MTRIDLNCDLGERPELLEDGTQRELMRWIRSANVACGGHAGDEPLMRATLVQAIEAGVAIGAHPGYEDPEHFGRRELNLDVAEVAEMVHRQVKRLADLASACGTRVSFVKPHGALYNQAATNRSLARAIAEGVARWRRDVFIVGLAGPAGETMLAEYRAAGFEAAAEAFADRRYESDGRLRSREFADSLLDDPELAARQAVRIAQGEGVLTWDGTRVPMDAQTLCVHSDTPGSVLIVRTVREALNRVGVRVAPLAR
ncbi:MAG: 5-oxoprolinase subunit PxpA [Candidatus Eiseniibacteriota bacterium]